MNKLNYITEIIIYIWNKMHTALRDIFGFAKFFSIFKLVT